MAIYNFRKLEVWQYSMNLAKSVCNHVSEIPSDKRAGLISPVIKYTVSIPSNIAEGSDRSINKDFANFLSVSFGSCYELETQLIMTNDIFNIDCENAIMERHQAQKMIVGFKNKLLTDK